MRLRLSIHLWATEFLWRCVAARWEVKSLAKFGAKTAASTMRPAYTIASIGASSLGHCVLRDGCENCCLHQAQSAAWPFFSCKRRELPSTWCETPVRWVAALRSTLVIVFFMEKILIVEDDPKVQRALQRLFGPEGFQVDTASDGPSAIGLFRSAPASAVVLDLRLPGMPGRDVCRELRQISPAVPIIVVSAVSEVMDKVLLLELGADDYVTKPFSPKELLARVRVALRRAGRPAASDAVAFDDITVDFAKMQLKRSGTDVP